VLLFAFFMIALFLYLYVVLLVIYFFEISSGEATILMFPRLSIMGFYNKCMLGRLQSLNFVVFLNFDIFLSVSIYMVCVCVCAFNPLFSNLNASPH